MIFSEDPEGTAALIQMVRDEYQMDTPRDESFTIHGTSLIYCLTKQYWQDTDPLPPTDEEVTMWSVGFGLERRILARKEESVELDGIVLSPDFRLMGSLADLKTTMMAPEKSLGCAKCGEPYQGHKGHKYEKNELKQPFQPPSSWVKQFQNYAYVLWKSTGVFDGTFRAAVLHLVPRVYKSYLFMFEKHELEAQWQWELGRRDQYIRMRESGNPEPFGHLGFEGECNYCRYKLRCELSSSINMNRLRLSDIMRSE
jgi:hypothetical protein